MAVAASTLLHRLEDLRGDYGGDAAVRKLDLLNKLAGRRLSSSAQVLRLHEVLCFLQAYPDDAAVLAQVERLLDDFARRSDLRRYRRKLADTGIAGTDIDFSFFWPTARWLARRYPRLLTIDWAEFAAKDKLTDLLGILLPFSELPALEMLDHTPQEWLDLMKGADETDAEFLIRRFAALRGSSFTREKLYESLDVPMRITAADDSPTRSRAKLADLPVTYQTRPLDRSRPNLKREIVKPPLQVRMLDRRDGQRMIDTAVAAMITRSRDLDAFAFGNPDDVRLVDFGDGLQFACIGQIPERRLLVEAVYGFLTLKNGVPIGYVLTSSLFDSAEIAYNVFDSFRGAEAAYIFARVLAMAHHLFGARSFSIDPFQLGHDNSEGAKSGAWWFYYKLGFRPEDPAVRRLLRSELQRLRKNPDHRSTLATLQQLSAEPLFLYLAGPRDDMLAKVAIGELGLKISRLLADRYGADRERALCAVAREAAEALGVRSQSKWTAGERQAWRRWSPLVALIPGVERWKSQDKQAVVKVIRAKGGRSEIDFVSLFDRQQRLRRAIVKLATEA